jgi:hypothetical protein
MTDKDTAHRDMADAIRVLAMDAVPQTDSGHPEVPIGVADVAICACRLGMRGSLGRVKGFGAFAKASDLYNDFGIMAEATAIEARRLAE